jgi:hypothetical protein
MAHGIGLFAVVLALAAAFASVAGAQELGFEGFGFSIPYDGLASGTAPADLAKAEAPAGAGGFLQVRGDDFILSRSGEPIRFWATNLSIEGCFPPHDVAHRMARTRPAGRAAYGTSKAGATSRTAASLPRPSTGSTT